MNKKIDFSILKNAESYKVSFANIDNVNANYVKKLREKLGMTQVVFATVLGVSKKAVEKWEQGKNPVARPSALIMYLIDNNEDVLKMLYKVELNPNFSEYVETAFTPSKPIEANSELWTFDTNINDYSDEDTKNKKLTGCTSTA